MKSITLFLFLSGYLLVGDCNLYIHPNEADSVTIEVKNSVALSRDNETITLSAEFIKQAFHNRTSNFIQIKDLKSNNFIITQSIDYDDDGITDAFLFQSNFNPKEKKEFALSLGNNKSVNSSKVYAAFMHKGEGMEDFTWENDFIGYRFYGQERSEKQGTGIAMDIWCKRVPELLTEKWYKPSQNYHVDTGYGADHYNSGKNQGCGGTGIFTNDSIHFSKAFSDWKIIANGPIRVVFELKFTGWDLNKNIVETKRVTLDAGHYFNKIESHYNPEITSLKYKHAVGFVQRSDSETRIDKDKGWIASWESLGDGKGDLGTGYIALPTDISEIKTINTHVVSLMNTNSEIDINYYTGAVWSEFSTLNSIKEWSKFIENETTAIYNPCTVKIK